MAKTMGMTKTTGMTKTMRVTKHTTRKEEHSARPEQYRMAGHGTRMFGILYFHRRPREFTSVLVSGLAALGVDAHDGFHAASNFTPVLSAVIKLARIMVVEYGFQHADGDASKPIFELTKRFMVIDSPTAMHWIFDIMTYRLVVHYTTTAVGHVRWEDHRLFFKDVLFTMDGFKGWVQKLAKECRHWQRSADGEGVQTAKECRRRRSADRYWSKIC
jgi:hypothetical protein